MSVIVELLNCAQKAWGAQTQNYCENYPEHDWPVQTLLPEVVRLRREVTKYGDIEGTWELRERIHNRERRRWEHAVTCSERTALVTNGATHALTVTALGLADCIESVIAFTPAFSGFADVATLSRKPFHGVPIDGASPEEALLESIRSLERPLVILNTPHNPTGRLFDDDTIAAVARAVSASDGFLLLDAVYDELIFESVNSAAPQGVQRWDRVVTINSFSKNYCLPGLRVGWLWCDKKLAPLLSSWLERTLVCVSAHAQLVALQVSGQNLSTLVADLDRRRRLLGELLASIPGATFELPRAGTSILVRFPGCDTFKVCKELAIAEGVVFLPAIAFPGGPPDSIRLSFGYRPEKIRQFCQVLRRAFGMRKPDHA